MPWYEFIDLSSAEKHERRLSLNSHGLYAHLSSLLPVAVFLVVRLVYWALSKGAPKQRYDAVPGSPAAKSLRSAGVSSSSRWASWAWWLGGDVHFAGQNWGRRDQLLFGTAWTMHLLFLCFNGTGKDYMHLTKRFGIVAASQMPMQYLLALKYLNPVAFAFSSSHEQVNRWHRVLGRIVYLLLCLHGTFYINYWIQLSVFASRIVDPIVILGVLSLFGLTLLNTTALSVVRQFSYRVFFITHLVVAFALPVAIFFHVRHARIYMSEALAVFVLDLAVRKLTTVTAEATLEIIPGTNLIKIAAKVPQPTVNKFRDHPASHVYMSIPPAARPSSNPVSAGNLVFEFMYNPFTVASVNEESREITLVARRLGGPVTQVLGKFAAANSTKIPLNIEGPFGLTKHFPSLVAGEFDQVLLFAGGVGGTFIVPLYQHIIGENPGARVKMIWTVREAAEATWPASGTEKSIIDDDRIELFLTGSILSDDDEAGSSSTGSSSSGSEIEMNRLHNDRKRNKYTSSDNNRKRPDLQKIVDDAFRYNPAERIAVLVCGPDSMAQELRGYVGEWVKKGRSVWWHNEGFGW
jgi:ferredoxin-NADP reductase